MKDKFYLQDAIDLEACEKAVKWFRATFTTKEVAWDELFKVCPSEYVWWLADKNLITPDALKTTLEACHISRHAGACFTAVFSGLITEEGWLQKMGYKEYK